MPVKSEPITSIPRLGPSYASKLHNLGIYTRLDLALHLPSRYQDRTQVSRLDTLQAGEEYYVQGRITKVQALQPHRDLRVEFNDGYASATMRLIHFSPSQLRQLEPGYTLRVYGLMRQQRQFVHPDYVIFREDPGAPDPYYHPIYRTTKGITSNRLRSWINLCLQELNFLPRQIHDGMSLADALRIIHAPDPTSNLADAEKARQRVAFDEMLAFTLLQRARSREHRHKAADPLPQTSQLVHQFLAQLPFTLTESQTKVLAEVHEDMARNVAMRRLVQGDVGSGKTIVAMLAALRAAESKAQTCVMAPTEILAEQHYETFSEMLAPLGINVSLLTSRMGVKKRRISESAVSNGDAQVAIGTHALFQESVHFNRLRLVIIDEQHRFGVHQRMELRGKGGNPHQLVMTATPIPRTLALTMFADLDISTITEMPRGRAQIRTSNHSRSRRQDVIDAVYNQLKNHRQAYWVCPAIEQDEQDGGLRSTHSVVDELTQTYSDINIGHIHGRMKADEKSSVMHDFRDGKVQLLVATTVIEVGIDVPNASIMVIENAEHFGLAQLHQLRGRIGRGSVDSFCMLIYEPTLSDFARRRLTAVKEHQDGFKLADLDMQLRGQGQIFGTQQSGTEHFKIADTITFVLQSEEIARVADAVLDKGGTMSQDIIETWTASAPGYVAI